MDHSDTTTEYPPLMPIESIDDWDRRIARQDAFWRNAIIDRPVISLQWSRGTATQPPTRRYAAERDRWFDVDRIVDEALRSVANTRYSGDALPRVWPNLGPEVFSAFFGQELEFTSTTSWSKPILESWPDNLVDRFSERNEYWRKIEEITEALLEAGRGRFYVGITDLHPGGDALAAFRDPAELNTDLLVCPEDVRRALGQVTEIFLGVYDHYVNRLREAGQAITTWLDIASKYRWYVPSNDFSCMISKEMFDELFLPGIQSECRHFEASIYHLDGPNALRHLDSILGIPELNALQWVYGDGHGRASDWIDVYRRCQSAGKGIQLGVDLDELSAIVEQLKPEGVWLRVNVHSEDEAAYAIKRISSWVQ